MRLNSASQSAVVLPGRMAAISRYISDMWVRRRSLVASVGRWNTSGRPTASKKRCQRASTYGATEIQPSAVAMGWRSGSSWRA